MITSIYIINNQYPIIRLFNIEFSKNTSRDDLPISMIFITYAFRVECYLNSVNHNKYFWDDCPLNHSLSCIESFYN